MSLLVVLIWKFYCRNLTVYFDKDETTYDASLVRAGRGSVIVLQEVTIGLWLWLSIAEVSPLISSFQLTISLKIKNKFNSIHILSILALHSKEIDIYYTAHGGGLHQMLNIFFCILLGIHEIKNPSIYPSIVYNYCLYNIFFQLHSVAGDPRGIDYV